MTAGSFRSTPTICFTAPACRRAPGSANDRWPDRGADLCDPALVAGRLFRVSRLHDDEREHRLRRNAGGDRACLPRGHEPVLLARLPPPNAGAAARHGYDLRMTVGRIAALLLAI